MGKGDRSPLPTTIRESQKSPLGRGEGVGKVWFFTQSSIIATTPSTFVIVHPHPNPPHSRERELVRSADKYSPSTGGLWLGANGSKRRGLGGGGAELLLTFQCASAQFFP